MNVASAIPVSVVTSGWGPGAYGIWGIIIIQLFIIFGVAMRKLPEIILAWVASRKQDADEGQADREWKATEKASITDRVSELEKQLNSMNAAMGFLMNAALTATNALESVSPDHVAIKQSRDLIGMAAAALGNNDPFSLALHKLGNLPGRNETN